MKKGFVDLQINGHLGKNFSSDTITVDDIRYVTKELIKEGTMAYCPTVVTNSMKVYNHCLPVIAKAMEEPDLKPYIFGIHMEGPFISPEEGARGAHTRKFIIKPILDKYKHFQDLAQGKIVMITLAPEINGTIKLIEYIVKNEKTVVSLGHHHADVETIKLACLKGAKCCTHLGNGINNSIHRFLNPLWAQLSADSLWGMFITDGVHLPAEFIKTALRAKTLDRFIVTSDAASISGLKPGEYNWLGKNIVIEKSGRISLKGTGYLAGSNSTMINCMNYLASLNLLKEDDLWKAGFENPLKLIGRKLDEKKYLDLPDIKFKNKKFIIEQ
ncbi:MAG: amidohydrolase family protein [Elusimicrobia bacterium]|nr:amidohydrolase family protein [Elusimicrobiota bacterium]MBU2614991.1 amidohydrolase family protein [Elusimicrobiota bacterium]